VVTDCDWWMIYEMHIFRMDTDKKTDTKWYGWWTNDIKEFKDSGWSLLSWTCIRRTNWLKNWNPTFFIDADLREMQNLLVIIIIANQIKKHILQSVSNCHIRLLPSTIQWHPCPNQAAKSNQRYKCSKIIIYLQQTLLSQLLLLFNWLSNF
jgi:hypothetical protein